MQNKHIIRFSFLSVFIIVIANILLYRQFIMENIILREIFNNDKLLVEAYQDRVRHLLPAVIKKLRISEEEKPFSSNEFENFVNITVDFFKSPDLLKVQIIDSTKNEIFSTNDLKIEHDHDKDFYCYIMAKLDRLIFRDLVSDGVLIISAIIKSENTENCNSTIAIDHIPIVDNKNQILAQIVIYRNITNLWHDARMLEFKVFLAFFIFFMILFIIIFYNTRYAQNIINKQVQANKMLEEAKRKAENESVAKTYLLANVSHELRTPLNSIIGFSEIILSDKDNKESNMQRVQYVYDAGKHLLSVINDLLDYFKVTAKKLKVDMIEVDINKVITSSMRFLEPDVKAAKISLITDIPDESLIIRADPKRLKQALLNVLSNAVKFTPANGNITVNVTKVSKKKRVYIRIIDTGIGISKENLPKALSSFEQVDNKKNRRYEGTGLGLPLTKELVELMKGTFDISSVAGQGTIVTLSFKYEEE